MMMGNDDAVRFLDCSIPDMLGELDEKSQLEYDRFANRVRYLVAKDKGEAPNYHKGRSIDDYWTCGNCGSVILGGVNANVCEACGFDIVWDNPRCLTGVKKGER